MLGELNQARIKVIYGDINVQVWLLFVNIRYNFINVPRSRNIGEGQIKKPYRK